MAVHTLIMRSLLSSALVSSVQLAMSASNTGGAWDNPKKYISASELGPDHAEGSDTHTNSMTCDTVGDSLKDTSGPALNIVMKLATEIEESTFDVGDYGVVSYPITSSRDKLWRAMLSLFSASRLRHAS